MKVLMITGDKNIFKEGSDAYKRFQLQRAQVDELKVVYWGKGSTGVPSAKGFDIVTSQDPFWRGLVAWRAAKASGAKLNLQLHTDLTAQSFFKRMLASFLLKRASSIRVVSNKIKESLTPLHLNTPISVLPIFVDVVAVRAAASADLHAQYPQFTKILLVASRLEPEKNVAAAIELMPEVLKALPDAGLLIAGDGSERQVLEQKARNLGVEKAVIFVGHRTDIYSLYKGADTVLQSSWYEGYGASIVEALAAGTPVVSADVGVAKEAGAMVVPRSDFAPTLVKILQSGQKGELKMPVLNESEWAAVWAKTLQ